MLARVRPRLTYANVVASLALFVALGGGAYAARSFVGSDGRIHACVGKKGHLTLVKPGSKCGKGTSHLAWNKRGPSGRQGPGLKQFEFFNDYDAFLYNVLTHRARGARYLGHGGALAVSRAALDDAIAALRSKQGSDPSRWRAPMPQIQFQSLDVADLPSVPWENRGTWGEAIALPPLSSPAPGG